MSNEEIIARVDALTEQMRATEDRFVAIDSERSKEDAARYEAAIKRQQQAHRLGIAAAIMPDLIKRYGVDDKERAASEAIDCADALLRAAKEPTP